MNFKKWGWVAIPTTAMVLLTACGDEENDAPGSLDNDGNESEQESVTDEQPSDENVDPGDEETGSTLEDEDDANNENDGNESETEDETVENNGSAENDEPAIEEALFELSDDEIRIINGKTGNTEDLDTRSNGDYLVEGYLSEEEYQAETERIEVEDAQELPSSVNMGEAKNSAGRFVQSEMISEPGTQPEEYEQNFLVDTHSLVREGSVPENENIVDDDEIIQKAYDRYQSSYNATQEHLEIPEFTTERAEDYQNLISDHFYDDKSNVHDMISIVGQGWQSGIDDFIVSEYAENTYYWQADFYDNDGNYMGTLIGRYYDVIDVIDLTRVAYTDAGAKILVEQAESDFAGE